ncbi:hypothetical protein M9H77_32098 [Catharanthus roseus]|uniref:Uncharacterized protein n=1 Tax=Catharanthus roseus TaxID=4058 RepID=A0ACC0A2C3_CATRO|nr:hypothetical protein M9H77_32098 [Catharanthus roseus]
MSASTSDVKVLGSAKSPFVIRVEIALKLKSIEYEFIEENNYKDQKSELLLQSNPIHKKIPVFFHSNKPISESLIIVQYIDETWPDAPSILPSDPYDRATARFWATYIDNNFFPIFRELKEERGDDKAKRAILDKIIEGLSVLENAFVECSKGKSFFGGDTIGYVDISLGCILGWLKVISIITTVNLLDQGTTPRLVQWSQKFCAHEAVKAVLPETQKLLKLIT